MQMNTCARTLASVQWWIGRRSRSMLLMDRKSRSTRARDLYVATTLAVSICSGPMVVAMTYSPSRAASAVILSLVTGEGERVVGDGQGVVLGHLVPADDFADPDPDLAGAVQAPGNHGGGDLCQLGVGGFSSARRLRARSAARAGLRHATRRSPG